MAEMDEVSINPQQGDNEYQMRETDTASWFSKRFSRKKVDI
jgi:hypothetical protein